MPKQLYFNEVNLSAVKTDFDNDWYADSSSLVWNFTAPESGNVIVDIGFMLKSATSPTFTKIYATNRPPTTSSQWYDLDGETWNTYIIGTGSAPSPQWTEYIDVLLFPTHFDVTISSTGYSQAITGLTSGSEYTIYAYLNASSPVTWNFTDTYFRVMEIL